MISDEDILHVARLARIELKDEEVEEFKTQFQKILEYFEILDEVDETLEPAFHVSDIHNVFRDDVPEEPMSQEDVLSNAPRREKGYFRAPRIV